MESKLPERRPNDDTCGLTIVRLRRKSFFLAILQVSGARVISAERGRAAEGHAPQNMSAAHKAIQYES